MPAVRKVELELEYQNYIEHPPITPDSMYRAATSADDVTIKSWRETWLSNIRENKKRFGSFKDHSVGKLFGINRNKPCVVIGSGPSLRHNVEELKKRGDILTVSCLHNYHFLEDKEVGADYYVTLDAGELPIEEVSEGGSKTPQEYWDSTKDKKLIAYIGTNPKMFDKWQGEVYFFNHPTPDVALTQEIDAIETFNCFLSSGGNVLGASMYAAKGIFGSNPIAYIGADFSFGYDKKFHSWNSKYDAKMGQVLKVPDVFGNKVYTWQSYYNFKFWFDNRALTIPGIWINCTEGGTFGAYQDGNLMAVKQMPLKSFLDMYNMCEHLKPSCLNPETKERVLLF